MERIAEYHVWPPLYLEVLLHVLTDHFDLAVMSRAELMDDQVRIVATEVVEENRDFETDRALQVTLAVGGADKPARDVVVVTDFGSLRLALYKLVTADVASSGIIILLLLSGTEAHHRPIRPEYRHDLGFPHDKRIKKLGERVLSDLHHGLLMEIIESRGEYGSSGAHFVLLN